MPDVHVSKLKPRKQFPTRPPNDLRVEGERFDFDEAMLPEDSWAPRIEDDGYEVTEILDCIETQLTRQGRRTREYLVKWLGYEDPSWVREDDLSCGGLLYILDQRLNQQHRFQSMQTAEDDLRSTSDDQK